MKIYDFNVPTTSHIWEVEELAFEKDWHEVPVLSSKLKFDELTFLSDCGGVEIYQLNSSGEYLFVPYGEFEAEGFIINGTGYVSFLPGYMVDVNCVVYLVIVKFSYHFEKIDSSFFDHKILKRYGRAAEKMKVIQTR